MRFPVRIAIALLLLTTGPALAAEFEVNWGGGLASALAECETNGEDNVITLAFGRYDGNFEYRSNDARSLTIRTEYFPLRGGVVLDALGTGRPLGIYVSPQNPKRKFRVTLQGLILENGDATGEELPRGGGLCVVAEGGSVRIENCIVRHCRARDHGGGVYVAASTDVRVERCLIHENETVEGPTGDGRGGGIAFFAPGGTWTVASCVLARNTAATAGGGLWIGSQIPGTRNVVNNTIYANSAPAGAGIYVHAAQTANVMNNWIGENTSATGGEIAFYEWYCENRVGYHNSVGTVVGGWTEEAGNAEREGRFYEPERLDFGLNAGSPLIDSGRNDAPGQSHYDHEGRPRVCDGDWDGDPVVDIGAFEVTRHPSVTVGSRFVVGGTGLGERKPKLYVLYEKKPGKLKTMRLKVLAHSGNRLEARLRRGLPHGLYPLFCRPKGKGAAPIPLGEISFRKPGIYEPSPAAGPPGTPVTLTGLWFGSRKPKVYLVSPYTLRRRRVRVIRLEFHETVPDSELDFVVPNLPPGTYGLRFENRIGSTERTFVVTE